ncbi:unnamed protein product [Calypogeia fissa]
MLAPMAQTQNFPQHRTLMGMLPGGGSFHSSSGMVPSHSDSSIASFVNSFGGEAAADLYRSSGSRSWQVPAAATTSDLHNIAGSRWSSNSIESSTGHCSPSLDTFNAAYSELFESPMRGTSSDSQQPQQQQGFMDHGSRTFSTSVASMLSGGSSGLARTLSAPLGGGIGVTTSPRLNESWTSKVADHGNLGLTVDPSKGGLALQGAGVVSVRPQTASLPRFSANPGFAERAARFSAFGNGQYSPSFPLTENGNVGRSPCFENDNSSKRSKLSVGASRQAPAGGAPCLTEAAAPERNSLGPQIINASEVSGVELEKSKTKGDTKVSGSSKGHIAAAGADSGAQVDGDELEKGQNDDEAERIAADSDASNVSRGQPEASCSDQVAAAALVRTSSTGKKRKSSSAAADEPAKETAAPSSKEHKGSGSQSKRSKDGDVGAEKEEQRAKSEKSGSESSGTSHPPASKDNSKPAEQPKLDYIHVRARRGQATDSHSLAERVRREKISERMKYLQDLVPGCSKVTGKAVMLDEIINYVQSIQRQVEFLSMKLAAVTPRPDFSIDNILNKQVQMQIGNNYGIPTVVDHADNSPSFAHMQSQQPLHMQHGVTHNLDFQPAPEVNMRRLTSNPIPFPRTPVETFDVGQTQTSSLWDGDLQSVVQMGFGQSLQGYGLGGLQCDLPPGHMKMEL